jgi:hypothetical protein
LSRHQYIELNIRIQKSLILDFDFESANESAVEDWKIDIERELIEKGNLEEGIAGDGPNIDRKKQLSSKNKDDESVDTNQI